MPKRYNVDHLPVVVENDAPAIKPGDSYDFTPKQLAAGIAGVWSETDPRGPAPRIGKSKTDLSAAPPAPGQTTKPAEPEKESTQ